MNDTYTELNQGTGGSVMDEGLVEYFLPPFRRHRSRMQVSGVKSDAIADVLNKSPKGDEYGVVTRSVGVHRVDSVGDSVLVYGKTVLVDKKGIACGYVVLPDKKFMLTSVVVSGDPAEFTVVADKKIQLVLMTTNEQKTVPISSSFGLGEYVSGTLLQVVVSVEEHVESVFHVTLSGRVV